MIHQKAKIKTIKESEFYQVRELVNLLTKDYTKILLELLKKHPEGLCVTDIYIFLRIDQSVASAFLRKLYGFNVIKAERQGKQILYSLDNEYFPQIIDHIKQIKKLIS